MGTNNSQNLYQRLIHPCLSFAPVEIAVGIRKCGRIREVSDLDHDNDNKEKELHRPEDWHFRPIKRVLGRQ
jgi:hypothetical protein